MIFVVAAEIGDGDDRVEPRRQSGGEHRRPFELLNGDRNIAIHHPAERILPGAKLPDLRTAIDFDAVRGPECRRVAGCSDNVIEQADDCRLAAQPGDGNDRQATTAYDVGTPGSERDRNRGMRQSVKSMVESILACAGGHDGLSSGSVTLSPKRSRSTGKS